MGNALAALCKRLSVIGVAAIVTIYASPSKADVLFDLNFSGSGFTGDLLLDVTGNPGTINSIVSGTQNGFAVTGLVAPGSFGNNDNTIGTGIGNTPNLSFSGLTFSSADGNLYNIYGDGTGYVEVGSDGSGGNYLSFLALSPVASSAPAPIPGAGLTSLGFLVVAGLATKGSAFADFVRQGFRRA